jgi:hypothetical protein
MIRSAFSNCHGADVSDFCDDLLAFEQAGKLRGVVGIRPGGTQPFFLRQYLDHPVQTLIERHTGRACNIATMVEIANLAVPRPGDSRRLFVALTAFLHGAGFQWAMFTAIAPLIQVLRRMSFSPQRVAMAHPDRLRDGATRWGDYYERQAHVCIGSVTGAAQHLYAQAGTRHGDLGSFWQSAFQNGRKYRASFPSRCIPGAGT